MYKTWYFGVLDLVFLRRPTAQRAQPHQHDSWEAVLDAIETSDMAETSGERQLPTLRFDPATRSGLSSLSVLLASGSLWLWVCKQAACGIFPDDVRRRDHLAVASGGHPPCRRSPPARPSDAAALSEGADGPFEPSYVAVRNLRDDRACADGGIADDGEGVSLDPAVLDREIALAAGRVWSVDALRPHRKDALLQEMPRHSSLQERPQHSLL